MMAFLIVIFVLVCFLLMLSVLLQSGKGEGLAGTFGGAGSQFIGGRAAATFLTKTTTTLAAVFMLLSILLSTLGPRLARSDAQTEAQRRLREATPGQVNQQPAVPPAAPRPAEPGQGQ